MKKSDLKEMIADVINEVRQEQHQLPEIKLTEAEIDAVLTENARPFKPNRMLAESTMTLQEMEDSLRRDFEADAALLDEYMSFKEQRHAERGAGGRFAKRANPSNPTTTGSGAKTTTVNVSPEDRKEKTKKNPPKTPRKKGNKPQEPEAEKPKKGKPSKAAGKAVAEATVNVVINDMARDNPEELAKLYKKLQDMEKQGKRMEEMLAQLMASSKVQQAKKQVTPEITTTPPAPVPPDGPAKPGGLFSRIKTFVKDNKVGLLVGLGTIAAVAGAAALAPAGIGSMIASAMASKTVRNALMAGASGFIGGAVAKKAKGGSWKDSLKSGLKTGLKAAGGGAVIGLGQDIADKFMGGVPMGNAARAASDSAFTGPGSGDNSNPADYETGSGGGDSAFNVGGKTNPSDAEQFSDDTDSGLPAGGGEEPRSDEPEAGEDAELASIQGSRNAPLPSRAQPGDTNDDDDVQFGDKPDNLGAGSTPDAYNDAYERDQETAREDEEGVDTTPAGVNTDADAYERDQETAREDEEGVDTTPAGGNTDEPAFVSDPTKPNVFRPNPSAGEPGAGEGVPPGQNEPESAEDPYNEREPEPAAPAGAGNSAAAAQEKPQGEPLTRDVARANQKNYLKSQGFSDEQADNMMDAEDYGSRLPANRQAARNAAAIKDIPDSDFDSEGEGAKALRKSVYGADSEEDNTLNDKGQLPYEDDEKGYYNTGGGNRRRTGTRRS